MASYSPAEIRLGCDACSLNGFRRRPAHLGEVVVSLRVAEWSAERQCPDMLREIACITSATQAFPAG